MARPELGKKRICVACGAKFYDLTKSPAICPKCGTEQPPEQPRVRVRTPIPEVKIKPVAVADDVDVDVDVEVEAGDDEAEDGVLEDTSDLEDDADALGADIEVGADPDDTER